MKFLQSQPFTLRFFRLNLRSFLFPSVVSLFARLTPSPYAPQAGAT